jgi:hypothetical protein
MARRKVTWVERSDIYYRGERCFGLADKAAWTIEIDPKLHRSPRSQLITEIEELFHLKHPDWPERKAKSNAAFFGSELWRRGYRPQRRVK